MSSSPQPGPVWFSTYCPSTCSGMRASKSIKAKQGLGTPPGSSRQASVSLAPLTPRCGSVTQPCRPSNRGSLHLGFLVAILHMLLPSCKPHAPSRTRFFKASARCPTFSPHGCCFCFVLPRAAVTFCGHCHLWLRSPLRKPMTRLSPPALRICWGPARSRTTRSALPSSLSSKVASACGLRSSWADTLPVLHRQLPRFAADVVARLGAGEPVGPALRGVLQSQAALAAAGFDLPTWDAVILGAQAPPPVQ